MSIICLCDDGHLVQAIHKGIVVSFLKYLYVLREIVDTGKQDIFINLP